MVSKKFALLSASLILLGCGILPVRAISPNEAADAPKVTKQPGDLSIWEERLLGRQYPQDPIDKRVQRLELLLFGATQDGGLSDRLSQLRDAIAATGAAKSSSANAGETVKMLEQRVLKSTFPRDQLSQRLSRIELKVFGKASPAMGANERIDRLKRTLGIGEAPPIANSENGMPNFNGQFRAFTMPFGDSAGMPDPNELNRQFSQMFKQLNEQLRTMPNHQMPMPYPHTLRPVVPKVVPNAVPNHIDNNDQLPPYLDPHSI